MKSTTIYLLTAILLLISCPAIQALYIVTYPCNLNNPEECKKEVRKTLQLMREIEDDRTIEKTAFELAKNAQKILAIKIVIGAACLATGIWLLAETWRDIGFREVEARQQLKIWRAQLEEFATSQGIYFTEAELKKLEKIESIHVRIKTFWREIISQLASAALISGGAILSLASATKLAKNISEITSN